MSRAVQIYLNILCLNGLKKIKKISKSVIPHRSSVLFVSSRIPSCNLTFPAGYGSLVLFFLLFFLTVIHRLTFSSWAAAHGNSMPNQWANDHCLGTRPTRHPREISGLCSHCVGAECKDTATLSSRHSLGMQI